MKIVNVIQWFLSPLVALLALVSAPIFVVIFLPIRTFVSILAKLFRKDLNGLLKLPNVVLANDNLDSASEFNIQVCSFYNRETNLELVREKMMERIFLPLITNPRTSFQGFDYDNLRSSVTTFCGYYAWKRQKDFHIADYVKSYSEVYMQEDFEDSEDKLPFKDVYDDQDLKKIITYLTSRKWRKNYSPWQIIVLENYRKSSEFSQDLNEDVKAGEASTELQTVIIYQFHHCMADGYSILNLIMRLNDFNEPLAAVPRSKKENLCLKMLLMLVMPFKIFWDLMYFVATKEMDDNDWINAPRSESGKYYTTWTPSVPVERIKKLKTKFDVAFLAITKAVGAGAMRKVMIASGAKVPERVTSFVPFPLPNHRYGLRIHCATACMHMHIGEPDTVKRVAQTHKTLRHMSGSTVSMTLYRLYKVWTLGPNFVSRNVKLFGITTGMSPFPGVSNRAYLTPNHACSRTFFTVGLPSTAPVVTNMTTLSSDGNIIFTFTARRNVVQSRSLVEKFNQYVEEELQALENAYSEKLIV